MPRFDGPEHLAHETPVRALLETTFLALEGRVVGADALFERVTRAEAARGPDGMRTLVPFAVKSGLVVRLQGQEGRILEVSLGDLSPTEARLRLDEALGMLAVQPPAEGRLAPLADRERRHFGPRATLPDGPALAARFTALLDALERRLAESTPAGVKLTHRVRAYVQIEEKIVADLDGLWRTQCLPQCFVQIELHGIREPARSRYVVRFGELAGIDALVAPDGTLGAALSERVAEGVSRTLRLLQARALTPEERKRLTHYVLDASAMVFIHEACGHNFEADLIQQGVSGLFRSDGSPVDAVLGSPAVNLIDGPPVDAAGRLHPESGFGTQLIDDEGVEVEPVVLLERGRVAHVLHSRATAGHQGVASNGRGFSELGQPRLVRMTNTYLLPSDPSFQTNDLGAFLADVRLGIWLEGSNGGEVTGDGMSTTIQCGRLIRDGRLTDEWLLPCTLSVKTRGALKTVESFFGPPAIDRVGFCGKGQTKTVTTGGCAARLGVTDAIAVGW